jgi:hypothetical protein
MPIEPTKIAGLLNFRFAAGSMAKWGSVSSQLQTFAKFSKMNFRYYLTKEKMKRAYIICSVLLMSGCVSTEVLSSSDRTVVVRASRSHVTDAQALADAECKKHGRYARLSTKESGHQIIFDCIE